MMVPSQDYRRTDHRVPPRPLAGLDAVVNGFIGCYQRRGTIARQLRRDAETVDALASEWTGLSDHELQSRLLAFREQFRRGPVLDTVLFASLAAIREAADRTLRLRPFVVQLMGALALHRGYLAEMATGEGKTLTAGLAAILAGWTKRPCHIVTVNDYLVERDAKRLEPLYHFCGIRVGCVVAASDAADRLKHYGCDVTYVTSKELLADFLRDRLRLGKFSDPGRRLIQRMVSPQFAAQPGVVMRGLHTAIVDEADSVLIDEAVTPLIISEPRANESLRDATRMAQKLIGSLAAGTDYRADHRYREVELTPEGTRKLVEQANQLPGFWRGHDRRLELVIQALIAREFYHRDKQYIVQGDKLIIVDEFTGRPMPNRHWRQGMHQAVEAKEGLPLSDPAETVARLSFQRFFRCFRKLCGMTGTATEAAGELWQVYGLAVIPVPTNRPGIRKHLPDKIYLSDADKWNAIVDEVVRLHTTGRPLLVGTRNVQASEELGRRLSDRGLNASILNATRLAEEADIVALAGEPGRITIATNMAGRGTDIKLGQGVAELGGLHVIATERHESGRVDRQLFGRSARQGDPGSAQAFVSAEDELVCRHLRKPARKLLDQALRRDLGVKQRVARLAFRSAQTNAQAAAFKQRKTVLKSDLWLEEALSFAGGA